MARWLSLFTFLTILSPLYAQEPDHEVIDPSQVPPQISIVVKEHPAGPDLITITMLDGTYPLEQLQAQIIEMGRLSGTGVRGLQIGREGIKVGIEQAPNKGSQGFVKATFATDNIIDRPMGTINLSALVKPFVNSPKPYELHSFLITFDGEKPNQKTLKVYADDYVSIKAEQTSVPPGLEYRIVTYTTNPDQINIPTEVSAKLSTKPATKEVRDIPMALIISLVVVCGLAAGALVYFALLKTPRGRRGS